MFARTTDGTEMRNLESRVRIIKSDQDQLFQGTSWLAFIIHSCPFITSFVVAVITKFPVIRPNLLFPIVLQAALGHENFIFILLNICYSNLFSPPPGIICEMISGNLVKSKIKTLTVIPKNFILEQAEILDQPLCW